MIVDIKTTLLKELVYFSGKFLYDHLIDYNQKYEFVVVIH